MQGKTDNAAQAAKLSQAVTKLEEDGLKVQVVGRVVNGKIELDPASLEEMKRKYPDANISFVAVNAPFDPVQHTAN